MTLVTNVALIAKSLHCLSVEASCGAETQEEWETQMAEICLTERTCPAQCMKNAFEIETRDCGAAGEKFTECFIRVTGSKTAGAGPTGCAQGVAGG